MIKSIDAEVLAITCAVEAFELYILNKHKFLIRTDCEAIVKFYNNINKSKNSQATRRWINLVDVFISRGLKPRIEHIKGSENQIIDILSRIIIHKDTRFTDIIANTIPHISFQETEFLSPVAPYGTTNDTPDTIHQGYSINLMDQEEFSYNPVIDVLQKDTKGRIDRRRLEMTNRGRYKNIGERPIPAIPISINLAKLDTSSDEDDKEKWIPTKNLKLTKDLTFTDFTRIGKRI